MSRIWLVRLGEYGESEAHALETGELATGWELPGFTKPMDRAAILAELEKAYPDAKAGTLRNWAVQLNQFCNKAKEGDLTVTPLKTSSRQLAIGRIKGPLFSAMGKYPTRKVEWLHIGLPRETLKQDLLYSLGASQTVCEVSRNNAAARFEAIVKNLVDPGDNALPKTVVSGSEPDEVENSAESAVNLVDIAKDQIERHIASTFSGHKFTHLIAAILEADGYRTTVSSQGPDKGIDIVAGQGVLGFGSPKLVVQVKSGDIIVDQPTLQSLLGCIQDVHADHGLLVSWSGFKTPVRQRVNELYFRVRLWGREEILDALFRTYDRLPEKIRAELPLQKVWVYLPDAEA